MIKDGPIRMEADDYNPPNNTILDATTIVSNDADALTISNKPARPADKRMFGGHAG